VVEKVNINIPEGEPSISSFCFILGLIVRLPIVTVSSGWSKLHQLLSISLPLIKTVYSNVIEGNAGIGFRSVHNHSHISPSKRIIGDSSEMMSINIYL